MMEGWYLETSKDSVMMLVSHLLPTMTSPVTRVLLTCLSVALFLPGRYLGTQEYRIPRGDSRNECRSPSEPQPSWLCSGFCRVVLRYVGLWRRDDCLKAGQQLPRQ